VPELILPDFSCKLDPTDCGYSPQAAKRGWKAPETLPRQSSAARPILESDVAKKGNPAMMFEVNCQRTLERH
jgi:hypothetical protein